MNTKPESTVDWSWDAQARFDLLASRAADTADALSVSEFEEMIELEGRRKLYLEHRAEVEEWKRDQVKAISRPEERRENDSIGAKLAELRATRRKQCESTRPRKDRSSVPDAKYRENRGMRVWLEAQKSERGERRG
jgi:hypothetical protein